MADKTHVVREKHRSGVKESSGHGGVGNLSKNDARDGTSSTMARRASFEARGYRFSTVEVYACLEMGYLRHFILETSMQEK